ncbi:MAG: single-stranded DNA-binding protein, partial [Acidaminococcus fermentans]
MNDIINVARTNRYGSAKLKKNTQEQLEWAMKASLARDNRLGMQFPGHVVNVSKGQRLLVEGRLQIRKYQDKQGQNRTVSEVIADRVEFIEQKEKDA